MEKLEKVIAGMEACNGVGEDCNSCPYIEKGEKCSDSLYADALVMLREKKNRLDGDLISRSALIEEYEWLKSQVSACSVAEIEEHIERIRNAPTVDAVEVVRCKNCKWYRRDCEVDMCWCKRWRIEILIHEDHFCSYGERRTDV